MPFEFVDNIKIRGAGIGNEAFVDDKDDVVFRLVSARPGLYVYILRFGGGREEYGGNTYEFPVTIDTLDQKIIYKVSYRLASEVPGIIASDPEFFENNKDYIKSKFREGMLSKQKYISRNIDKPFIEDDRVFRFSF